MSRSDPELWRKIIEYVVDHGGHIIRPWFTDLAPISLEGGLLEIAAPGDEQQRYLQQHATRLFTDAAQHATGMLVGVEFQTLAKARRGLAARDAHDTHNASEAPRAHAPRGLSGAGAAPVAQAGRAGGSYVSQLELQQADADLEVGPFAGAARLNEEFTFENFVVGPSSRLAHAACQAVCENPGVAYNPLFIHGDSGLGKTHLMHAICHGLLKRREETRCCLLSCETFVNHFIESLEKGDLQQFRYRYRQVDVLVIDDVQFLAGRDQTQEEFFHTFNTLHQVHRQIVLSSDRSPAQIAGLEQRLVSRFNWGLVAGVDRPCYETRVAILRMKAQFRGIRMSDEVVCFIAGIIDSNIRELEGAISRLSMLASVYDRPIDMALAREALGAEARPARREVTVDRILETVMARFNVRLADLQSRKRSRSIAHPRQICMYLARELTNHSLGEIGGYFGGRDHTTVLHAEKTIRELRGNDAQANALIENLIRELQQ